MIVKCPRCRVGRLEDDGTTFRCACGYSYTPPKGKKK
jgi:rubredoxin